MGYLLKLLTVLSAGSARLSRLWKPNDLEVDAPQGAPPLVGIVPLHAGHVPYEDFFM